MSASPRLAQLDALRGLAALSVVLFHYTTRYDALYGHTAAPWFSVPWGHVGVNLFFMISGFVIFMTLERTPRPMDFVVSRFSRLYPAYWGALLLTFGLTHLLGLPGKTVGWEALLVNLSMVQGMFGVAHVDGVYWTLEVELLFYAWALLSHRLGGAAGLRYFLFGCLALRLVYLGFSSIWQIDLPWMGQRWLLLPYISWFALGVAIYRISRVDTLPRADTALAVASVLVIGLADGWGMAALALAFFALLFGAARARFRALEHPVWLWLGAISYTLYLLHENIGWAVIRRVEELGGSVPLAIGVALALSLALAHGLTTWVEQPAMRWIRRRHARAVAPVASSREPESRAIS